MVMIATILTVPILTIMSLMINLTEVMQTVANCCMQLLHLENPTGFLVYIYIYCTSDHALVQL